MALDVLLHEQTNRVIDAVTQWVNQKLAEGKVQLEDTFNHVKQGVVLGDGLTVFAAVEGKTLTIQFRRYIDKLFPHAPPAFVRAVVQFERPLKWHGDLPDISQANPQLLSLMADASIVVGGICELTLGFGYDNAVTPNYVVGRGVLKLPSIGTGFEVYIAALRKDGLVVQIGSKRLDGNLAPLTVIPIGSSGFVLTGVSGAFALNFSPNNIPSDAEAEAQAKSGERSARQIQHDAYVSWAKVRAKELDAWTPSQSPSVGLGLGCTIGDGISAGRLIKFQDVGFFALTPRNIIFIEGSGKLLDTDAARIEGLMLIDLLEPSWTAQVHADVTIPPPTESWEIVSASGAIDAYISLRSLSDSQLSIGTKSSPVTGKFFKDIIECSVYVMLNSRRVAAGARVWIDRVFGWGKVGIKYQLSVHVDVSLGWNPIQIFCGAGIGGRVDACFFLCIGFGLSIDISLALASPVELTLTLDIVIGLPWPLSDIHIRPPALTLKYDAVPPVLDTVLRLTGIAQPSHGATELGAVHPLSGRQWIIDPQGNTAIWPDAELVIPFSDRPTDSTGLVINDGLHAPRMEQGYQVSHIIEHLSIEQFTESKTWAPLSDVRAVWVSAGGDTMTSRLHIPADNPFLWLLPYEQTYKNATLPQPLIREQDFGKGPNIIPLPGSQRFGEILATPTTSCSLVGEPHRTDLPRILSFERLDLQFLDRDSSTPMPITDAILFVIGDRDRIRVSAGTGFQIGTPQPTDLPFVFSVAVTNPIPFDKLELNSSDVATWLWKVRYRRAVKATQNNTGKVILPTGRFRLSIDGTSRAVDPRNGQQRISVAWPSDRATAGPYRREFKIENPDTIRPYIRWSTFGDSRIFSGQSEGFNPSPHGLGLPAYQGYRFAVRFLVPYMGRVFQSGVTVERSDRLKPEDAKFLSSSSEHGTNARDQQWKASTGAKPPTAGDHELGLEPTGGGNGHHNIVFYDPATARRRIDEWQFEVSRFQTFTSHLTLTEPRVGTAYSSRGPVQLPLPRNTGPTPSRLPPAIARGPNVAVVPKISLTDFPQDWWLPKQLLDLVGQASGELISRKSVSSLPVTFLKFANRSNCRFGGATALEGVLDRPAVSRVDALLDSRQRPYCLWLRTPEPADWRRVKVSMHLSFRAGVLSYEADLPTVATLPSPDGSSAFLIPMLGEIALRLPIALIQLTFTFAYVSDGLPRLQRLSAPNDEQEVLTMQIDQSWGEAWPAFAPLGERAK